MLCCRCAILLSDSGQWLVGKRQHNTSELTRIEAFIEIAIHCDKLRLLNSLLIAIRPICTHTRTHAWTEKMIGCQRHLLCVRDFAVKIINSLAGIKFKSARAKPLTKWPNRFVLSQTNWKMWTQRMRRASDEPLNNISRIVRCHPTSRC